jgi:hypothetical protein
VRVLQPCLNQWSRNFLSETTKSECQLTESQQCVTSHIWILVLRKKEADSFGKTKVRHEYSHHAREYLQLLGIPA